MTEVYSAVSTTKERRKVTMKITDETRKKVLTIMNLAMLLNSSDTKKAVTGEKPTITVTFFGHTCYFEVNMYENGYARNEKPICYETYLDGSLPEHSTDLDKIIGVLTELCGAWGVI